MHRRLSVLRQWSKERFGSQNKTETSDEFKAMETEMQLRHSGLRKIYASTKTYVRWLSKRYKNGEKTKDFPISQLGAAMLDHSTDFDDDVEFGQCLAAFGEVQERLGRLQEAFLANVINCWEESLEHSLTQLADYYKARKLLEEKRLAYDAARNQLSKSKKEDPRLTEAVVRTRNQYADLYKENIRLMREISEAENDTIVDLTSLLGAQISYHERCRDALLETREDWPASTEIVEQSASQVGADHVYRSARSLASTANVFRHDDASSSEASGSTDEGATSSDE